MFDGIHKELLKVATLDGKTRNPEIKTRLGNC